MKTYLKEMIKKYLFRYTSMGRPLYDFNVEPIQLTALINEFERLKKTEGCICEIGVARGSTTKFLAEHITLQGEANNQIYYAIDTFSSFTAEDMEHEVKHRGKKLSEIRGFEYNDYDAWSSNFRDKSFIKPIKADCSKFDYSSISPIKMSFLDVDLYLPTKGALPKLYDATTIGGVILVDDCTDKTVNYDGAYQAYMEFCEQMSIEPIIIGNKCGVIYK